jgi:hypothetical protein
VRCDLTGVEQAAGSVTVDADVIGDGVEVLDALAHQRSDQIFGNAAESEAAEHDGSAIVDIGDGFIRAGDDFIHRSLV